MAPALKPIIHQRQPFSSSVIDGRTTREHDRDRPLRRKVPPCGERSRRRSNQEMLREAVLKDLDAEEEVDVSHEGRTS
jgi:hypothetical protein